MIIFIGDIHGDFEGLSSQLTETGVRSSVFIQVGDFGVGFKAKEQEHVALSALNELLRKNDNTLYAIRGNHDDPSYFKGDSSFSNLVFLKDYSLVTAAGKNLLLAGGAISVDRTMRSLNVSYWNNEGFVFDEPLLAGALEGIAQLDLVVTHNAPAEFHPTELNQVVMAWAKRDSNLLADLEKERQAHSHLLKALNHKNLKPQHWLYGHYHYGFQGEHEGIRYRILDAMEWWELKV